MGLLDDLTPPKKVWPCKVKTIAETLDTTDQEIMLAAVMNPDWQILTLSTALRAKGLEISEDPITKHRRKVCSCWKI